MVQTLLLPLKLYIYAHDSILLLHTGLTNKDETEKRT